MIFAFQNNGKSAKEECLKPFCSSKLAFSPLTFGTQKVIKSREKVKYLLFFKLQFLDCQRQDIFIISSYLHCSYPNIIHLLKNKQ